VKKKIYTILISIIVALIFVEILSRLIITPTKYSQNNNRYMLFVENKIFKNYKNFFLYYPNREIINKTYYFKNKKFLKEYEYKIKTNNFGLVQTNNLDVKKDSILFLGDSFTEGQGWYSWIDKFNGSYKNFQTINGGFLGTGPEQFYNLENYLSKKLKIKKVIFIFLGDDFLRGTFNISEKTINCLENSLKCQGDERFYGISRDSDENKTLIYLKKIKKYRDTNVLTYSNLNFLKQDIKNKIKGLNIVNILKQFLEYNFFEYINKTVKTNLDKTQSLIDKYDREIIFIRLSTKQEIDNDASYISRYVEKKIKNKGKKVYICDFNNDLSLFYRNDGHPNSKGYNYLYRCVNNILDKEMNNSL